MFHNSSKRAHALPESRKWRGDAGAAAGVLVEVSEPHRFRCVELNMVEPFTL